MYTMNLKGKNKRHGLSSACKRTMQWKEIHPEVEFLLSTGAYFIIGTPTYIIRYKEGLCIDFEILKWLILEKKPNQFC